MTKNEAIWGAAVALYASQNWDMSESVAGARYLADEAEKQGVAPWLDAPAQRIDASPAAHRIQFDLPTTPERRGITEADVVPGAVFRDEDGDTYTVISVADGMVKFEKRFGVASEYPVWQFVERRNKFNATIAEPATPARREITAEDVVPGAVFRDEDGAFMEVIHVENGEMSYMLGGHTKRKISVEQFVLVRNTNNATVTLP